MGVDPRTSVVNPRLACHAVPNIFVASAAVFPFLRQRQSDAHNHADRLPGR